MPRTVDRVEREAQITAAAIKLMAQKGPAAVTVRSLAEELGGSITLVTHFYPTRADIFRAVARRLIQDYDRELEDLTRATDPRERLRQVLIWLLPLATDARKLERARVLMSGEAGSDAHIQDFFAAMERKMRSLLRACLRPLVSPQTLETHVDAMRALTNGVVLSVTEHPRLWTKARQVATVDLIMEALYPAGGTDGRRPRVSPDGDARGRRSALEPMARPGDGTAGDAWTDRNSAKQA